jgi:hypothetical protein
LRNASEVIAIDVQTRRSIGGTRAEERHLFVNHVEGFDSDLQTLRFSDTEIPAQACIPVEIRRSVDSVALDISG